MTSVLSPSGVQDRPATAAVPPDVATFLDDLGATYGRRDHAALASALSSGFLFQGMRRARFLAHVRDSFVAQRIDEMRIVPTLFDLAEHRARIVAYAETNLGILPQAADVLPLVGGCEIVREAGAWRLDGNQSRSPMGIYARFRSITASLAVVDERLYRTLLPPFLQLPAAPSVRLVVTDYLETTAPLPPYRVLQVQLACRHAGTPGWYPITLPETAWMPVEGGRTLGYPKFVAEEITVSGDSDRWTARCRHPDDPVLRMTMTFEPNPDGASWFERHTQEPPLAILRKSLPAFHERPWFLVMSGGPSDGTKRLLVRGDPEIQGLPNVREVFGRVRLSVDGDQSWIGLRHEWTDAAGALIEFTGHLNLGHRLVGRIDEPGPLRH
jgi:Acetoacetate decarboxylase (ADC)